VTTNVMTAASRSSGSVTPLARAEARAGIKARPATAMTRTGGEQYQGRGQARA
jgi:hypothetical protein